MINYPVPHRDLRPSARITAIVLHDTGGENAEGTLSWFMDPASRVSSHYLVGLDGTVYALVPDQQRAWHAGRSILHGVGVVNDFSIGIEIVDADDTTPYPEPQVDALVELVAGLCQTYRIPLNRVVGHADICIPLGRKADPGPDFPWFDFLVRVAGNQVL